MIHDRVAVGSKIEERKLILSAFCAKTVGLPLVVSNNFQDLLHDHEATKHVRSPNPKKLFIFIFSMILFLFYIFLFVFLKINFCPALPHQAIHFC